jgi:hypothetical protein
MSGGDKNDPCPFTMQQANVVLRFPTVLRMMQRKYVVDSRGYDIPYLAGYSDAIEKNGDDKDVQRLLILLRMTAPDDQIYYHAHGVATACELYSVELDHGKSGVKSYNSFMGTQVKRAEDERIRRVPANLDMTPYQGNDQQDVHLRAVMHAAMAA